MSSPILKKFEMRLYVLKRAVKDLGRSETVSLANSLVTPVINKGTRGVFL